ncbi:hypothetical protein DFH09DRAFT_1325623 [Mycena vulgaris]|nr:hypothetical protein DFH09DRAFT_1325623 [Mycena vulgaris]
MTLSNYPLCFILWLVDRWAFKYKGRIQYGTVPDPYNQNRDLKDTNEAEVIRYIKQRTTIPPPEIAVSATGAFEHFMVMKRIDGDPLDNVWAGMTEVQPANVIRQLREFIAQLRPLPPENPHAISGLHNRK